LNLDLRLYSILLAAGLLPACTLGACLAAGFGPAAAAAAAGLASLFAALCAGRLIERGLSAPVSKVSAAVKKFIADNYRLAAALPKEGWPAAAALVSSANRLMLELGAFRAFQINQVVEERGKAKALIETIPDGALLLDDRGGIIYSNRTALRLLGIPGLSEEVSIPASVTVTALAEEISRMLASEEPYLKACVELPRPEGISGPARTYLLIAAQFLLPTLKRPGRVLILRDVTQEMELEKTKESFFQMITHDMRAPLSSIMGYTQILAKSVPKTPLSDQHIATIIRAAGRLNGMITDILNTTKMERGSMSLSPERLESAALASRMRDAHAPDAERRKVSLAPVTGDGAEFYGDKVLLERVLSNLIGNAIKFTPPGGSVELSCGRLDGNVLFMVSDTGPGVPKDKREVIFEKYAQMEEHSSMGFGLGLAMCKLAVELHKGRIWVEPGKEAGSCFKLTLPAGEKPA